MCTISLKQPERSVCIGTRQEKKMSYQHIVEHKKTSLHKYEFPIYASLSHTMTGYECFVSQFWILNQCRFSSRKKLPWYIGREKNAYTSLRKTGFKRRLRCRR